MFSSISVSQTPPRMLALSVEWTHTHVAWMPTLLFLANMVFTPRRNMTIYPHYMEALSVLLDIHAAAQGAGNAALWWFLLLWNGTMYWKTYRIDDITQKSVHRKGCSLQIKTGWPLTKMFLSLPLKNHVLDWSYTRSHQNKAPLGIQGYNSLCPILGFLTKSHQSRTRRLKTSLYSGCVLHASYVRHICIICASTQWDRDILEHIFLYENICILMQIHWFDPGSQLTSQQCFTKWLGAQHYLNQWWHSSLTYMYITWTQLVNSLRPSDAYMCR